MTGHESWRDEALCAKDDVGEVFYPEGQGENSREAKQICAMCDVQTPCLEYALNNEVYGIWGGTSPNQRKLLRRQLGIRLPNDRRSA